MGGLVWLGMGVVCGDCVECIWYVGVGCEYLLVCVGLEFVCLGCVGGYYVEYVGDGVGVLDGDVLWVVVFVDCVFVGNCIG